MVRRLISALWRWLRGAFARGDRGADQAGRRRLIRGALVGLAGALAATGRRNSSHADSQPPHALPRRGRRQWSMAIDLDRCTGCNACAVACQQENNIPAFTPNPVHDGARIEWISMLWLEHEQPGGFPELLPFPCQQCEDPPCVKVCPVGATYKDPDGITMQIYDRCIGCRYCMVACPYGRRSFNWEAPTWDGSLVQLLNPDVATRTKGVVEKCTFCHHRIQRVREEAALDGREPGDGELQRLTACAAACPARAITFGDLNDSQSAVSQLAQSPRVFRLLEHLGTRPSVFYLRRDKR